MMRHGTFFMAKIGTEKWVRGYFFFVFFFFG